MEQNRHENEYENRGETIAASGRKSTTLSAVGLKQ
jgi:hypothetical protein